ncbi:MAG: protein translocase SEC61 complex subunit gamma [Candidatus Methanomethylophilus sp.]|jgi:protein transport protein SEC61 subunit gamma-like protein|nr:protein translocase subunit Sss1 [methanogenic archaeon ISO4-H5]MBO5518860.1 protein translocase SEC61 complex subunit gamma [Methanomethylophilus sp.]MBO5600430.1 protein translocase SEC61 complex subunit gamma [Methanomethylophilus sp.]MEE3363317.1 protein translocase SEC61 complex subunit gamma [Methanomethylophilus sp.]MEE3477795.1 protein translocase SEC61 complex subunit gamma [Methanomethylophilus sp.]
MTDDNAGRTKAEQIQDSLDSRISGIGRGKYGRILQMAHTPDKEEYLKTAKISALGILILGLVGFVVMWIMTYLPGYF